MNSNITHTCNVLLNSELFSSVGTPLKSTVQQNKFSDFFDIYRQIEVSVFNLLSYQMCDKTILYSNYLRYMIRYKICFCFCNKIKSNAMSTNINS